MCPCYKIIKDEGYTKIIATRNIRKFEPIFFESPILQVSTKDIFNPEGSLVKNNTACNNLFKRILEFAKQKKERIGYRSFIDDYPPEARSLLDELSEITTNLQLKQLVSSAKSHAQAEHSLEIFWSLYDCFGSIYPNVKVRIHNLQTSSDLNGKFGIAVEPVKSSQNRWKVLLDEKDDKNNHRKISIHASNLKTAGGIFRTNAYEIGHWLKGVCGLYQTLSRLNHSCNPNVTKCPVDFKHKTGRTCVVAMRHISKGDELFISYIGLAHTTTKQRLDILQSKFQFRCDCVRCKNKQDIEESHVKTFIDQEFPKHILSCSDEDIMKYGIKV